MSIKLTIGKREYFPGISQIKFEDKDSKNPMAFKWYDQEKEIAGKKMKDHLRFAAAYWHSFCYVGTDIFGSGTYKYPSAHPFWLLLITDAIRFLLGESSCT